MNSHNTQEFWERDDSAQSRAVLASIVENSDDPIIGKKLDGTVTTWNRAAEHLFGYHAADIIGRNITLLLPPDRLAEEHFILNRLRRGEVIDHYQSQRLTADGRLIDVALTVSPIRDTSGQIVGASKIVRDISHEKAAERAIREGKARFRQLADAMPEIVWEATPDGHVDYYNERWYALTGMPRDDNAVSFDDWRPFVHPEDLAQTAATWTASVKSGSSHRVEARLKDVATGHYRWHLIRALPVRNDAGQIARWFGTSTDIDDLKRAEQECHDSETKLQALMDAAVDGIFTLDENDLVQSVNPAMETMFGLNASHILNQPISTLFTGVWKHTREALKHSNVVEIAGKRINGDSFPAELSFNGWKLGTRSMSTGIIRDVTDRKRIELRAKEEHATLAHLERVRTLGQMAAGLAHELNQPLGAILNYSVAIKANLASPRRNLPQIDGILDEVISQTTRAGEIIRRLRAFVKKQEAFTQLRDINDLAREAVGLLSFDLRQANLHLQLQLADNLPHVNVDSVQIQQVLVNLLRNAIDAMDDVAPGHRHLRVVTKLQETSVCVDVCDSGCGIRDDIRNRIFDSFFTTKSKGLGIGLALCRTTIEEHGGHIAAAPNPLGGTIFSFSLRAAVLSQDSKIGVPSHKSPRSHFLPTGISP